MKESKWMKKFGAMFLALCLAMGVTSGWAEGDDMTPPEEEEEQVQESQEEEEEVVEVMTATVSEEPEEKEKENSDSGDSTGKSESASSDDASSGDEKKGSTASGDDEDGESSGDDLQKEIETETEPDSSTEVKNTEDGNSVGDGDSKENDDAGNVTSQPADDSGENANNGEKDNDTEENGNGTGTTDVDEDGDDEDGDDEDGDDDEEVPKTPLELFDMNEDETIIKQYVSDKAYKNVTIPDTVTVIAAGAFKDNSLIEEIIIPYSEEPLTIQESAFENCKALTTVTVEGNRKLIIGDKAFYNCVNLIDTSFADGMEVGKQAFDKDEEKREDEGETNGGIDNTDIERLIEELLDGIEFEVSAPSSRSSTSKSSSTTTKKYTHGKSKVTMDHGYDQIYVNLASDTGSKAMHTLTLDGEELELTLNDTDGAAREFTVTLYDWGSAATVTENNLAAGNTLILNAALPTAEDEEVSLDGLCWQMNGTVLRKLSKSGIDYLVFQMGDQLVSVPTEGFLGGWAYDDLRSRGAAGSWFDYAMTAAEGADTQWTVTVDGKSYEVGENRNSAMYLIGVETGTEEILAEAKEV